ncbi:MAG: ABC transporter permease [Terriglobales bacterium]
MSGLGLLDKQVAVFRRDLLTALRYRTLFWMQTGGMLAELAAFYYLAVAVGPQFRPEGMGYFPFLLVGTAFYGFLLTSISSFVAAVREAQVTGTMEVLMTTSTPAPLIVVLTAISAMAGRILNAAFYVLVGLVLFRVPLEHPNLLGFGAVFSLSLAVIVALGIAAAAIQLVLQKGDGVVWLLGSFSWFLTGTIFPVGALPAPLQKLAALIPFTHSMDGLRLALLRGASFSELAEPIGVLALFAVVLLPLSLGIFSLALRRARLQGSLSFY